MKKHLVAAAVAAAVAVPVMAQNVSVYGILDVNLSSIDTSGASSETVLGKSALATSRLGFRGSEDLGGGLKAEFQLEGTLDPTTGVLGTSAASTSNSVTDSMFDREAWVGFSSGFGSIRAGTTDVSDAVNIDAKVSQAGDLGLISELSTDKVRTIRYTTPSFSGFSAQVGVASPNSTATSEVTNGSITNFYAAYEQGKLGVYAARESVERTQTYDQKQSTVGAKYDFGAASVGLVYSKRKGAEATSGAAGDEDYKQYVLSAAVPLANGYTLHGAYQSRDLAGTDNATRDFSTVTLAVTKSMSKRTRLYAAFIDKDFDAAASADTKQYTVGVVHNF